jgi:predicted DNA-binding protein with PD1-like motif
MYRELSDGRELLGIATILRDTDGKPTVHIHGSLARKDDVVLGCLREKVPVYLIAETIIMEVEGLSAVRAFNERLGVWAPVFEGSDR